MRVFVTGGTGYAGAWTVKALQDAGHDVRMLVRDPAKVRAHLEPIGVGPTEHVVGDMDDAAVIAEGVAGCDAVVHSAAMLSFRKADAQRVIAANVTGTRTVLEAAAEAGATRIVHVSSLSAIFDPDLAVLSSDSPVASPSTGYARSKADSDRVARQLRAAGAPVAITYPAGIFGPPAGSLAGESNAGLPAMIKSGVFPTRALRFPIIDVRDLALAHVALVDPACTVERVVAGKLLSTDDVLAAITRLTGRSFRVLPVPGAALRGIGRLVDLAQSVRDFPASFTHEVALLSTRMPALDDSGMTALGIVPRSADETLRDALLGSVRLGVLPASALGTLVAGSA